MNGKVRPRSPDVQIYRPQLTSVLSFTHRLTGIVLAIGAVALAGWLLAAATSRPLFAELNAGLASWPGRVALFVWTFALYFHLCNGIRHLFWDAVVGFELASIYRSGWIVVIASVILAVATWAIAVFVTR